MVALVGFVCVAIATRRARVVQLRWIDDGVDGDGANRLGVTGLNSISFLQTNKKKYNCRMISNDKWIYNKNDINERKKLQNF